jgi:hypothetical protein
MLEKINSKRFEKETISAEDQHQLRGGAAASPSFEPTRYCVTTCAVWQDCGTKTDEYSDKILPAANNISSR